MIRKYLYPPTKLGFLITLVFVLIMLSMAYVTYIFFFDAGNTLREQLCSIELNDNDTMFVYKKRKNLVSGRYILEFYKNKGFVVGFEQSNSSERDPYLACRTYIISSKEIVIPLEVRSTGIRYLYSDDEGKSFERSENLEDDQLSEINSKFELDKIE